MLQTMLEMMQHQAAATIDDRPSGRARWYREWARHVLAAFEPDTKVVYASAYAFPLEILRAFDVVPFDFELASGLIGTTYEGVPTMVAAEDRGLGRDTCSFHRISLGASILNHFPEPDFLVTASFYCDGKAKTNELLALRYDKPAALLYVPAEITTDSIRYVEVQLRQIARQMGEALGQHLDEDRLREAVRSSNRARRSQLRLLELLKHRPAPWGGLHLISYAANGHVFNGSPVKERLNDTFVAELEQRLETGNLRPERHRVYWFAWIPTYPSNIFETLKQHQVAIPHCELLRVFWDEIDEDKPFEGLALRCLQNPFVGTAARRTAAMASQRDEYALDGAILFATPACRHSKTAHRLLADSLAELGLPLLTLDMDIADSRTYSPEQTRTRLESFIELLDQNKAARDARHHSTDEELNHDRRSS